MNSKNKRLFYKIWWICKISMFIVLGDALLFWAFDMDLLRDSGIENMSGVAAIFIALKYFISWFSFFYIVIMAGVGLVCMDRWKHKFVKKLFPIKNSVIKWLYIPALLYIILMILFAYDVLWAGVFAMLCYLAANYFSAIWFHNAYNAYQPRNNN